MHAQVLRYDRINKIRAAAQLTGLLEEDVSPQRPIAPFLDEPQLRHPGKGRTEILCYMLWMAGVRLGVNARKQQPTLSQGTPELLDCFDRVDQMFEHVHRRNDVKRAGRQLAFFQVEKPRR